jgi:hypothetical protein
LAFFSASSELPVRKRSFSTPYCTLSGLGADKRSLIALPTNSVAAIYVQAPAASGFPGFAAQARLCGAGSLLWRRQPHQEHQVGPQLGQAQPEQGRQKRSLQQRFRWLF